MRRGAKWLFDAQLVWVAVILILGICCCEGRADIDSPTLRPRFEEIWTEQVTCNSARIYALINSGCRFDRVEYTITDDKSYNIVILASVKGDTILSFVSGLTPNTTYYVQAVIFNGVSDIVKSTKIKFTTLTEEPDEPDNPEQPEEPENPEEPDEPDTPGEPDEPFEPEEPENPDQPENPEQPEEPDNPNEPEEPNEPNEPEEPNEPDDSDYINFECDFIRQWFLSRYDSNGDGTIAIQEVGDVTYLDFNGNNITSTKGLELLPNLYHLNIEASHEEGVRGPLESIDLSKGWPSLTELYIFNSSIETLDLSYVGGKLTGLVARKCLLRQIDVSWLKNVIYIDMAENQFKELDFSGLDNLDELHIEQNPYLEEVTFNNRKLRYVDLNHTNIRSVDFSKCPFIDAVDLTGCTQLETVVISRKQVINTITRPDYVRIVYCD